MLTYRRHRRLTRWPRRLAFALVILLLLLASLRAWRAWQVHQPQPPQPRGRLATLQA